MCCAELLRVHMFYGLQFCGLLPHILACTEHKSIVYKGHFLFYNVNVALPNICKVYLQSIFVTNISQEYSIKKMSFSTYMLNLSKCIDICVK